MQACLTGALVVSMGVSNAPVAMAASNETPVGVEKAADAEDSQESAGQDTENSGQEKKKNAAGGTETTTTDTEKDSAVADKTEPENTTTEKTDKDAKTEEDSQQVIIKVQFVCDGTVVSGGDYFVPAGVQNYSVLEQYVPEGYKMTTSGDFMVEDGAQFDVNVEKISTDVTMNIQFKDGDEVVAGGDYTVPGGVQNYSVLEKYVPEGYQMTVSGDFTAEDGGKLVVNIEKISTDVTMNIQFKDGDEVIAGGDYTVPGGVQNYSVLEQYVPEGYKMTVSGDFTAEM